jgi:hypothetical protein
MWNKAERTNIIILIVWLFAISFFKDDFTPDYLNTSDAAFIGEAPYRLPLLFSHPLFWFKAIVYSSCFCLLPYFILQRATSIGYSLLILCLLIIIMIALYAAVFLNSALLDRSIIPKMNRFFHSPIFTLFFLAAYNINNRLNQNGG